LASAHASLAHAHRTSFTVSPIDRQRLTALVRDRNAPQKHVWRAEIILLSADGVGTVEIMRQTPASRRPACGPGKSALPLKTSKGCCTIRRVLRASHRSGPEISGRVVALTLANPPGGTTHWTADMMAARVGISASAVRRIWKARGLQPHRWQSFKLSMIRSSSTSCATWSASMSTRRPMPSCCLSTRRAKSRRSTAASPVYP
jgi:hypothetical protein